MGLIRSTVQISLILGGFGLFVLGMFSAINTSFLPVGRTASWVIAGSGIVLGVSVFGWIYLESREETEDNSLKDIIVEAIGDIVEAVLEAL